jgi:hypothetical protein
MRNCELCWTMGKNTGQSHYFQVSSFKMEVVCKRCWGFHHINKYGLGPKGRDAWELGQLRDWHSTMPASWARKSVMLGMTDNNNLAWPSEHTNVFCFILLSKSCAKCTPWSILTCNYAGKRILGNMALVSVLPCWRTLSVSQSHIPLLAIISLPNEDNWKVF